MQMFFQQLTGHKAQHGSQQEQSVSKENNLAVEEPSRGDWPGNPPLRAHCKAFLLL